MPSINPTVLAWRAAAVTAFSATLAETLKLKKSQLAVTLSTHKSTAAVQWATYYNGSLGVTLYLPKMDVNAYLTRTQADTLTGYWLHEAGHVLYTPEDGLTRNRHMGSGYCALLNGLEDVRMEGAILKGAPTSNARSVLTAITRYVAAKGTTVQDPIGDANRWRDLPWSVAYLGRAHCHGYDLGDALRAYAATLNPTNRRHMAEILRRLALASDYADIEALAAWIHADIYPAWDHGQAGEKSETPGDNPEGEGGVSGPEGEEGSEEGAEAPGDTPGVDSPEGDSSEGEGGEGETQAENKGEGPKGETKTDAGNGSGQGGNIPDRDDMASAEPDPDALAEEINKGVSELELEEQYDPASGNEPAANAQVKKARAVSGHGEGDYTRTRDAFHGVHAVRAQVRRLFEAPEYYAWNRHQEKGRFDPQAAARVAWGARDVFAVSEEAPGYNTAVQIMLDGSSSMTGPNMFAAVGMAAQIAEVAQAKACPCQVDIFQTGGSYGAADLAISRILAFDTRINPDARLVFAGATVAPRGGTPLAAAVVHGGLSLDRRAEPRRLLVVLTDGGNDRGPSPVAKAVAAVRAKGMAVVALGLGISENEQAFAKAFAQADARATSDQSHLAALALRTIADALAGHAWGLTRRAAA